MAIFVVELGRLSSESTEDLVALEPGKPDKYGVKYLNVIVTDSGEVFTFIDAWNKHMAVSSQRSMGVSVEPTRVHPVWVGSLPVA